MTLSKSLYPFAGYFFEFELLEVVKETTASDISLKLKYSLKNINPVPFIAPIHISHIAYLDCEADQGFERCENQTIVSDRVVDMQNDKVMYGYGDDHHVSFAPDEKREFLVLFGPSDHDFDTFDIEFFMKPDDDAYGLYRLRYDFRMRQVTRRFCLKRYTAGDPSTQPSTTINKHQFSLLFARALEAATVQAEKQLRRSVSRQFEIELHGAGKSGCIVSPAEALDILFIDENRFYRIIDTAVIAVWDAKTRIFLRISSHAPGRFEDTWNQPSGAGPFKQILADPIQVYGTQP